MWNNTPNLTLIQNVLVCKYKDIYNTSTSSSKWMKIQGKLTIYNLTSIFIDTSILTKFYGHIKMFFFQGGQKGPTK